MLLSPQTFFSTALLTVSLSIKIIIREILMVLKLILININTNINNPIVFVYFIRFNLSVSQSVHPDPAIPVPVLFHFCSDIYEPVSDAIGTVRDG